MTEGRWLQWADGTLEYCVRGDYDAEKKVRFKYPNMGIVPVAMANVSYNFYDNKNCTGETVACTLYEKPEKK